jgi:hypothetical protein
MMMAATGEIPKVTGSKIDIAPTGPMPGRTPIRVPISTPKKQAIRFEGWRATPNP